MKITKSLFHAGAPGLSLLATSVMAAVSPAAEAAKLGKSLTPMGAEMAGNADGSIPAWKPIPKNAGSVDSKGFLSNPYASEKPLFIITAQNVEQYKDKLAPGEYAMFKRYPETFKMPVYPSHRGATVPDDVFAAIKRNATNTNADPAATAWKTSETAMPFPIPKSGVEVLWNHITRYRGGNLRRMVTQATPQTNGSYTPIRFEEEVAVPQAIPDIDAAKAANVLSYFKQIGDRPGAPGGQRAAGA